MVTNKPDGKIYDPTLHRRLKVLAWLFLNCSRNNFHCTRNNIHCIYIIYILAFDPPPPKGFSIKLSESAGHFNPIILFRFLRKFSKIF